MEETEHQRRMINLHSKRGRFTCPECEQEVIGLLRVENPGEERTQIYCHYGCGYIFLEDYPKLKNQIK